MRANTVLSLQLLQLACKNTWGLDFSCSGVPGFMRLISVWFYFLKVGISLLNFDSIFTADNIKIYGYKTHTHTQLKWYYTESGYFVRWCLLKSGLNKDDKHWSWVTSACHISKYRSSFQTYLSYIKISFVYV